MLNKTEYLSILRHPSRQARVKTRWWWYGCRVKEKDIIYQLDEMARAGIGGVELQITYPLQAGNDNAAWFSPEYFRILTFTSEELKKRGMTLDLTLGSSWPFGGPFVPFSKSAVHVIPLEISVQGPMTFDYDLTNRVTGEVIGCVMGQMEGCEMLPETMRDISGCLADKLLYNWPWGTQLKGVPVPEGVWKIVVFAASQFREHVLMPTRGAEGYVIDHNNREAMRFFLEHAGTPLADRLGRGAVENFFCDSLEVFGNNWAIGLYDEFEKRRGYSLRPYIYALWGQVKDLTDRIRYDFHRTLSELTVEGFFREMTDWCHEVGSKSRIQAHGTWGDVLLAYAAADVPEGETFSAWDKFSVNTVHRRLASSAGHLYGKNVISNESFTWLRFPRFCVTPEQIKIAADSIFADGINQIVNHGYSYSPASPAEDKGFSCAAENGKDKKGSLERSPLEVNTFSEEQDHKKPGPCDGEPLYFYASSNISHTNTWWKYYPHLSAYMNRVSDFLQKGEPAAQLCIYLPQADIWAENPLSDLHMCMRLEERIETAAVDAVAHRGYWFDYINDDAILEGKLDRYEALIIMETKRMPGKTARQIREYAGKGGLVVCAGGHPAWDCGMEGTFDVAGLFEALISEGKIRVTPDKWGSLTDFLEENLTPYLRCQDGIGDIGYVCRRLDDHTDLFFVANMSLRAHRTNLILREKYCGLLLLDPLTGKEVPSGGLLSGEGGNSGQRSGEKPGIFCQRSGEKTAASCYSVGKGSEGSCVQLYIAPGQSFLMILEKADCEVCDQGLEKQETENLDPKRKDLNAKTEKSCPETNQEKSKMETDYGEPGPEADLPPIHRFYSPLDQQKVVSVTDLSREWELTVPTLDFQTQLSVLEGFEKIPRLRYYSGEVIYRKEVWLAQEEMGKGRILLQAEEVGCCARVRVNGRAVADWIMRPYLADITEAARPGTNTLEIAVSNLLINRFLDPDRKIYEYPDRLMDEWPYFPQQLIKERGKRLDAWRERELVKEPVCSGLTGAMNILIWMPCNEI